MRSAIPGLAERVRWSVWRRAGLSVRSGLALLVGAALLAPTPLRARELPRPESMRPAIEFWKGIFATYSENQVVVHDAWYLGKVYEVLDFRTCAAPGAPLDAEGDAIKRAQVSEAKEHWRQVLLELHAAGGDAAGLGEEHRRAARLFADSSDPDRFLAAADRLRTQQGLRERFSAGVARQARYLPEMEAIFRNEQVPLEIVRLPLVESCFNVEAYSKVGAAGPWQFMPSTGRQYLHVGAHVDERRDPIRATQAAARHLRGDYESLGAWPLAVTAYNHGRGGLHRAVRETGTSDIATIVQVYRGPAFGFASRNFYAELIAANEVVEGEQRYFPTLRHEVPLPSHEVPLERSLGLREAARRLDMAPEDLLVHNPAFLAPIASGRAAVPAGYRLRVPGSERSLEAVRVALARGGTDPDASNFADEESTSSSRESATEGDEPRADTAVRESVATSNARAASSSRRVSVPRTTFAVASAGPSRTTNGTSARASAKKGGASGARTTSVALNTRGDKSPRSSSGDPSRKATSKSDGKTQAPPAATTTGRGAGTPKSAQQRGRS